MAAKILLVEDDAQIAFIVKETLEEKDYEVTWATTGLEGLEDFKLVQYDLVLIDLMLPEMDGYSLCNGYAVLIESIDATNEEVLQLLETMVINE